VGGCCPGSWIRYPWAESEHFYFGNKVVYKYCRHMSNSQQLMPECYFGTASGKFSFEDIEWLRELGPNTFFAIWMRWPSEDKDNITHWDLPEGHPLYVVSFHLEPFDFPWLRRQWQRIKAPIIVLNDNEYHDFDHPSHVHFYTYFSWHHQIGQIIKWFPNAKKKNIKYKASALCNRITQSKLLIFTSLMEYLDESECLVKLSDWLEEKNVHYRQPTGNPVLDTLTEIFFQKYFGKIYQVDGMTRQATGMQFYNSNPWLPFYTEAALHFTNESFHYSKMQYQNKDFIVPGPHLSEKTLKCLVSGTPFIPVGQYNSYGLLKKLGLLFDYGLDLSWDQDPGNLTRLQSIVDLIKSLSNYQISDLIEMTKNSTDHNTDLIWSEKFSNSCKVHNEQMFENILKSWR
jgi:hypothetical protein